MFAELKRFSFEVVSLTLHTDLNEAFCLLKFVPAMILQRVPYLLILLSQFRLAGRYLKLITPYIVSLLISSSL